MKACNSKLYSFTKISGWLAKITTWKTRRKRPQQNGREGARANKPAAMALRGAVRGRTTWLRVRAGCVFIIRDSVAADTSTVALPATLNNFSNCTEEKLLATQQKICGEILPRILCNSECNLVLLFMLVYKTFCVPEVQWWSSSGREKGLVMGSEI